MHAMRYMIFLLGLLALYAVSVPVESTDTRLARRIKSDVSAKNLGLTFDARLQMEKRRGRGGRGGDNSRKRPRPAGTREGRKTKQRKQKGKKQQKIRKQKTKKGRTGKHKNGKHKNGKHKNGKHKNGKHKNGKHKTKDQNTRGKKNKQCKRADSGNCDKTLNYRVAEAAAKKKGQTLQLNQAYMLKYETGNDWMAHSKLIVGTVRKNRGGQLDFVAAASSLTFNGNLADIQGCNRYFGAKCKHGPTRKYECSQGPAEGNYKFKGSASPVFADKDTFLQAGEMIFERNTKYNILYNNCQTHVKKLKNVAKLKPGEDPTVPEEERPATPDSENDSGDRPGGGSGRTSHDNGSDEPGPLRIANPDTDSD